MTFKIDVNMAEIDYDLSKELHKPITKKFKRRKIITTGIDEIWAMDLVEIGQFSTDNNDFKFLLVIIDSFSRFVWVVPLKNKDATSVLDAFKNIIFDSERQPQKLHCDAGKEFLNKKMEAFLTKKNITIYHTYSENKSAIVERFNRTLKSAMWRFFTQKQTHCWLKFLPEFIEKYNTVNVHSSIKMTPEDASKKENEEKLLNLQYKGIQFNKTPKFNNGDSVRISKVNLIKATLRIGLWKFLKFVRLFYHHQQHT